MSGDGVNRVASILCIFDAKASASSDLVSLHSPEKFSTLASKHRTHDQFNAASGHELCRWSQVVARGGRAVLV